MAGQQHTTVASGFYLSHDGVRIANLSPTGCDNYWHFAELHPLPDGERFRDLFAREKSLYERYERLTDAGDADGSGPRQSRRSRRKSRSDQSQKTTTMPTWCS